MKIKLLISIIIIKFIIIQFVYCQGDNQTFDTTYIQSYRNDLVLTLVSVYNSNTVGITDNNNNDLTFSTNLPFYFGIAVDYKWFTFEFTKNINTSPDDKKGETDSKGIGFGITSRKYWLRCFYKDYKGYYMQNPDYDNSNFNPGIDPYPIRNDLHTLVYFANLNYGFNYKKFSNTASLWQLERQKKSAGSFTVGLSVAYTELNADSALVISKWEPNFNKDALITNYHLMLIGINGGYLYTFSMLHSRRLFLSLALIPGLSYQFGGALLENNPNPLKKSMVGTQVEARVVLGYIHNKWYTSLSGNLYAISNAFANDNSIAQSYTFLRLVYGRKFHVRETKSAFLRKVGL